MSQDSGGRRDDAQGWGQPGGGSPDPYGTAEQNPYQPGEPPSYPHGASAYGQPSGDPSGTYASGQDASSSYSSGSYSSSPYPTSPYSNTPYGPGQYGTPPSQGTDGFSIAALVTGILGMAIVPIVLGVIGLNRVKRTGQSGRGLAIAGIVLGAIGIVMWLLLIILGVAFFSEMDRQGVFDNYGPNPTFDSSAQV